MARSKAVSMAITANSTGLRSEIARVNKTLDTLGASAKKAASDLGVLKTIEIGKIGFAGISAGADIITGLGTSALQLASRVSTAVDSLNDLSLRTGIALKPLQGFTLAAKLAGVDAEGFAVAVTKMSVNIGKAEPGDAFAKSLGSIGVSLADLQGMNPEAQFSAISKAIGEIPTTAGRAAASVEVFGKAGASLAPLFKDGAASLADLTARAERLGIILQGDQVANIAAMNDGFDLVSATVDGIIGQILGDLSPVVTKMLDDMLKFVEAFQGAGGATGGTAIAQAITDGILTGVKFFLEGVQSLEKVFLNFLMSMDQLPGITVTLPEGAKRVTELRSMISNQQTQADALVGGTQRAAALGLPAPRAPATGMTLEETNKDIAMMQRALAASEKKMGSSGVQVAIDFIAEFTKGIEAARLVPPSGAGPGAPFPLNFADSPEGKAAAKAAAESAKAAGKASEDAASRVAGLQPTGEKARITFLKDIAAINVTIADAEINAAAARKAGDADAIKAAEDRLSLTYEQAGLAVQIANENRREKELAATKTRNDLTKQADEIKNTLKFDLAKPSRAALVANDVRTSAGASQVASFRRQEDDPALDEAKAATKKLEEIKQKLDALNREPVDML